MKTSLRITFVLPGAGTYPCGGPKVVYEYANHLSARGHQVTVVHSAQFGKNLPWMRRAKSIAHYVRRNVDNSYRPDQWFHLYPAVRMLWVPSLDEKRIPDADAIVATWWETAEAINGYSSAKGKKFYLIQGLETWSGSEKRVYATWKMPFNKIVISQWLAERASNMSEKITYIPNGLDLKCFGLDVLPQDRSNHRILMPYHAHPFKGSADGLEAISRVKRKIPDLQVALFGVSLRPSTLPDWIDYHRNPPQATLRKLYNQSSIFIAPSWSEGWGLPASEAMLCGAAVVATENGGHREFAFHEQTALLSPPKRPDILAANTVRLISDPELRIALAERGNAYIQQFTWDKAVDKFEATLLQHA